MRTHRGIDDRGRVCGTSLGVEQRHLAPHRRGKVGAQGEGLVEGVERAVDIFECPESVCKVAPRLGMWAAALAEFPKDLRALFDRPGADE